MTRTGWIALIALLGCGSHDQPSSPPPPHPGSAAPIAATVDAQVATDWIATCEIALRSAPKVTPARRIRAILDGCRVCNGADWKTLLDWNTPAPEGPARTAIDAMMESCGYCDANGKQRFLGSLDAARGASTRTPWRLYGEVCGERASAVPDTRYMSAPYFALDKIARAAAANPTLAPLLDAIELTLPAVSISGVGPELPEATVMQPRVGQIQITVIGNEIRIGLLPRAKLGAAGVVVDHGGVPYPGALVARADLEAAITRLLATARPSVDEATGVSGAIALFAPAEMRAAELVPVIAALAKHRLVIAVAASGAPTGWTLPAIVPVLLDTTPDPKGPIWRLTDDVPTLVGTVKDVPLTGKPTIVFDPKLTKVRHLAGAIGVASFKGATGATIQLR
ncbi:MAG: hypothetical protein NT062_38565 [Proteobacteria bacterium]|nr:hypothetical protein [Pseudomonadota bacterium]